jgi:hypothetical protein
MSSGILLFLLVKDKNYLNFDRNFVLSFYRFFEQGLAIREQMLDAGCWMLDVGVRVMGIVTL